MNYAYSPDLAPSYFHLFPNLKKHLRGMQFSSNEEVQVALNEYTSVKVCIYFHGQATKFSIYPRFMRIM